MRSVQLYSESTEASSPLGECYACPRERIFNLFRIPISEPCSANEVREGSSTLPPWRTDVFRLVTRQTAKGSGSQACSPCTVDEVHKDHATFPRRGIGVPEALSTGGRLMAVVLTLVPTGNLCCLPFCRRFSALHPCSVHLGAHSEPLGAVSLSAGQKPSVFGATFYRATPFLLPRGSLH